MKMAAELEKIGGISSGDVYDFAESSGQTFASAGIESDGFYFVDHGGAREPVGSLFYRLMRFALRHSQSVTVDEL